MANMVYFHTFIEFSRSKMNIILEMEFSQINNQDLLTSSAKETPKNLCLRSEIQKFYHGML